MADAWHHRSDAITSVAAFIGISIALILETVMSQQMIGPRFCIRIHSLQ
jgi:divalent metal cation (Fe/Co/Zn/Cd) transporter